MELRYIEKIRRERYGDIITAPAPVSEENFRRYGASTTPTLVLVDRAGIGPVQDKGDVGSER